MSWLTCVFLSAIAVSSLLSGVQAFGQVNGGEISVGFVARAGDASFESRVRFLEECGFVPSQHLIWLRVSMVSHAARMRNFEVADRVFVAIEIPLGSAVPDSPIFMAAELLAGGYYRAGLKQMARGFNTR